jgi:hypothetical protein
MSLNKESTNKAVGIKKQNLVNMLEQRRGMIPASSSVPIMVYVFPDPGKI